MSEIEEIQIEIEGVEFEARVEFNYTPGRDAVLFALPEDCSPEEPEEFELTQLEIMIEDSWQDVF